MTATVAHPAKFTDVILATIADQLYGVTGRVLDPFAGTGRIHRLARPDLETVGVEIEPEWAAQHPNTVVGDALHLPFPDESFDAICTSPTYGNRMCLAAGTMITTWDGPTPIEEVQAGQLVLTHRGRWQPVTWAGYTGVRDTVDVEGQGAVLRCTPDHRIWTARRPESTRNITQPDWRRASALAPSRDGSRRRFAYWATPSLIETPDVPTTTPRGSDTWRFIGFCLGNGAVSASSTTGHRNTMRVSKDLRHVDEVEPIMNVVGAARQPDKGQMAEWHLYDSLFADWFTVTFGTSAYNKTVPGWTLGLKRDEREALLEGWLAADGCNRHARTSNIGVSVSERLIRGMQILASSIERSVGYGRRPEQAGSIMGVETRFAEAHRLEVHHSMSRRAHLAHGHIWYAIRNVEPSGTHDVYDLEVEEDHSFVANGIVVHNSDHHEARDGSKRHTYRHYLGRPLHAHNSGQLQWGDKYREFHRAAWTEARRVLEPGGLFILNIKNHIRKGEVEPVMAWHVNALDELGFVLDRNRSRRVRTPGQRHGANGSVRIDHELVLTFVWWPF